MLRRVKLLELGHSTQVINFWQSSVLGDSICLRNYWFSDKSQLEINSHRNFKRNSLFENSPDNDKFSFSFSQIGKVLVHCMVGMSRSATCALAYLMIARKMSAAEAIRTVRMHRDIHPNEGFLQQLADLDNELKRERLYYWSRFNEFESSAPTNYFWRQLLFWTNINGK